MASIVQTAPIHQQSFTRHSASSSLASLSRPPSVHYENTQLGGPSTADESIATKGHRSQMSFGMNGSFGGPNGLHQSQRGYGEPNGHMIQQQQHQQHQQQQAQARVASIYTAQYSGVSVYEMEMNGIAVMRRRSDSWLNATQILKVAGIDKGKRTKVLEKEILSGEHEKVQGGYGKYQGTWISYKRGREFCRSYGVEEVLRPLLEYDMGSDGQAGKGTIETPTKEQAMAAQRKKMMLNGNENRPAAQTPNGTFFKNISASAANAIQAISKARFDSPGPRPGSGNKRPANARRQSQHLPNSQESQFPNSSQHSLQSFHSEGSFGINGQLESYSANQNTPYYSKDHRDQEPPRKRVKPSSTQSHMAQNTNGDFDTTMRDTTPTEANESFVYHQMLQPDQDPALAGVRPLPQPNSALGNEKQAQLISLFMDPNQSDFTNHPSLDSLGGEDLDIPIDPTAHTVMHWGATLAKPSLIRTLIAKGASIFRVNHGGETALMRAVQTTNNYEQNSFSELLELLGPTIETRDDRGRTVLHHIAISSSIRGKSPACRYYLESLLEFVVRNGSPLNSQQASFNGGVNPKLRPIGLARFMSEIVNAQDMAGDTALNHAARNYSKGVVQQLLEVGANPSIPNGGGFKPLDFGVGDDLDNAEAQRSSSQNTHSSSQKPATINKVAETSRELVSSISTLIADTETSFRSELQGKQSLIDQSQSKLRDAATSLTAESRKMTELEHKFEARQFLRCRISNLRTSNDASRSHLATTGPPARADVTLGDADAGLTLDDSKLPPPGEISMTPELEAYLDTLPPSYVLEARLRAYQTHNSSLEEKERSLKGRSFKLEKKLRRLIALSTGSEERQVEAMLGPLRDAVESEGGEELDYSRLRDFLRKVGSEG